jgi:hypothetical protein
MVGADKVFGPEGSEPDLNARFTGDGIDLKMFDDFLWNTMLAEPSDKLRRASAKLLCDILWQSSE